MRLNNLLPPLLIAVAPIIFLFAQNIDQVEPTELILPLLSSILFAFFLYLLIKLTILVLHPEFLYAYIMVIFGNIVQVKGITHTARA